MFFVMIFIFVIKDFAQSHLGKTYLAGFKRNLHYFSHISLLFLCIKYIFTYLCIFPLIFSHRLRKDFKQLLEETGYVTPGKQLDEVKLVMVDFYQHLHQNHHL